MTRFRLIRLLSHTFLPRWIIFFLDIIWLITVSLISYLVISKGNINNSDIAWLVNYTLYSVIIYSIFFILFKSYAGVVRLSGSTDFFKLAKVTFFSLIIILLTPYFLNFKRTIFLNANLNMSVLQSLFFLSGTVFWRLTIKELFLFISLYREKKVGGILIYGCGSLGLNAQIALLEKNNTRKKIIGFIDDNKSKIGKIINGIPVYSMYTIDELFVEDHKIDEIFVAISKLNDSKLNDLSTLALNLRVEIRRVPEISTWINGDLTYKQIRQISIEDLLGRNPIEISYTSLNGFIKDKVILITGAAGSIGSELVRQVIMQSPKYVIALDNAETPLYNLEQEMILDFNHLNFITIIASISDYERMQFVFEEYKPDIIFHAAAYKHVPLMEKNITEAYKTNCLGTEILVRLAYEHKTPKFIMISSDKAVNPTNIMGATKRIAEQIVLFYGDKADNKTCFVTTRFGNVLGSNGSVVPLFKEQIKKGGPITITDFRITRYFMTIPEAVRLVLEAGYMGTINQLYVFDMGKPVLIYELAKNMIKLSGLILNKDIEIKEVGLRPGEKLYEELFSSSDVMQKTHHPKIFITMQTEEKINLFEKGIKKIITTDPNNKEDLLILIKDLVPEYNYGSMVWP